MLANYQQSEDNSDPHLFESYDAQQIQKAIEQADATIATGIGFTQGLFLAGVQSVSMQSLYAVGAVGFLPLGVAAIFPVVAFGAAITTVTIDNSLSISDLGKFSAGIARCTVLSISGTMLYLDNKRVDTIAKVGITTIKSQLDTYEKRPEKSSFNIGWILAAIVAGVAIISVVKNRRK